jgi:predicted O-methyltransferase YrrM
LVSIIRLKTALKHLREASLYLLLGKQAYEEYHQLQAEVHQLQGEVARLRALDTCENARNLTLPFASHMKAITDIHEHLTTLFMLTVQLRLNTILELGTRGGESTVALLYAAKEIGGKVFSIDVDECADAKRLVGTYCLEPYWQFMRADDLVVEWDKAVDHLFIDTSHSLDQTIKELKKYEPYVRRGGIITMHDSVAYPEVKEAALTYLRGRDGLRMYEYINNNGLLVLFKT